jgi:AAA domain, putative AbiEii toxin, Type IV TA system
MFLSFLTPRISLATLRSLASLDIDQRIQQLREILRQLGVRAPEAEANLTRYHDDLERAVLASKQRRQARMGFNEGATLLSVSQANDVISSWSEYQAKVAGINEGVTEMLSVLREYFDKKQVTLSDRGQLFFATPVSSRPAPAPSPRTHPPQPPPPPPLRPHQLSSGEKQIYIFLMEALLQRELISIFIADEPELSLHVAWQERLVNSILRLSPNAQLIFATHSPDIIGSDQDAIIEMEKVIENA